MILLLFSLSSIEIFKKQKLELIDVSKSMDGSVSAIDTRIKVWYGYKPSAVFYQLFPFISNPSMLRIGTRANNKNLVYSKHISFRSHHLCFLISFSFCRISFSFISFHLFHPCFQSLMDSNFIKTIMPS